METAFDLKDLGQKLKGVGLPVLESGAKEVVDVVLNWLSESVIKSDNKYDDLVLAVLPAVKDFVLKEIDKIDGKVG